MVLVAPSLVLRAACATPVMFAAISELPLAASATLRAISLVVAVCSSTALAMVLEMSLIWLMISLICPIAPTASRVSVWIASIFWLMSSVALAVSLANSFTSLATTAKPLPASPARAASMVALRASRLVCCAIEVMTLSTLPISALLSPSLATVAVVVFATATPVVATLAASWAFLAISRMLAPRSSTLLETLCAFLLICSPALATTLAWARVSSALLAICWLTEVSSSEALASVTALSVTFSMAAWRSSRSFTCFVTSVAYFTTRAGRPLTSRIGLYEPWIQTSRPPLPRRRYSPVWYSPRPSRAQNSRYSGLWRYASSTNMPWWRPRTSSSVYPRGFRKWSLAVTIVPSI